MNWSLKIQTNRLILSLLPRWKDKKYSKLDQLPLFRSIKAIVLVLVTMIQIETKLMPVMTIWSLRKTFTVLWTKVQVSRHIIISMDWSIMMMMGTRNFPPFFLLRSITQLFSDENQRVFWWKEVLFVHTYKL